MRAAAGAAGLRGRCQPISSLARRSRTRPRRPPVQAIWSSRTENSSTAAVRSAPRSRSGTAASPASAKRGTCPRCAHDRPRWTHRRARSVRRARALHASRRQPRLRGAPHRTGVLDRGAAGGDREAREVGPRGAFITCIGGWNHTQLAENRRPTKAELDAAAPKHGVYISGTGGGTGAITNSLGRAFFAAKG